MTNGRTSQLKKEKFWEDEKIKINLDKIEIADDYPVDFKKIIQPDKRLPKPKKGYKYAFILITMKEVKNVYVVNLEDSILTSGEGKNYKSLLSTTKGANFIKNSLM